MKPLYSLMRKIRHFPALSIGVSRYRRFKFGLLVKTSKTKFPVDLYGAVGFGAMLSHLVNVLAYCDKHGLKPYIRFSNRLYSAPPDLSDWFGNYFEICHPFPPDTIKPKLYATIQTSDDYPYDPKLTLNEARRVFEEYVAIKSEVRDLADAYSGERFGAVTLGVHYRATDKISEAPTVEWELVLEKVMRTLQTFSDVDSIFLTSDDQSFVHWMLSHHFPVSIHTYELKEVSEGSLGIHFTEGNNYQKGLEALITILLLSKCSVVVRTASHLSAWGRILNPSQKVVMLNQPFDSHLYFPDSEISKESIAV